MAELEVKQETKEDKDGRKAWRSPKLEDVSLKILAQPYIRFT